MTDGTASRSAAREPIAVVGMACRFPGGAESLTSFWDLLTAGRDGMSEVPADRWTIDDFHSKQSDRPGAMVTRSAGFVRNIDSFDAAFFGITPREASRMDPQQRLFLETTWEALEDAGIVPSSLAGTQAGVFVGVSGYDYGTVQINPVNRYVLGAHTMTGNTNCIIPNRVSYLLDLHGPSMAIDTACSSSLLATHLAVRSLRAGESSLAIVGGVNLLLNPLTTVGFSQGGFLSPDGRCRSFDARANGYARSEGAGCVVLKPLSAALADGNPIYALVRGSATNQDGRTAGMTAPSQSAQEALLRTACRDAGVEYGDVEYLEAHGTGTPVGDPIEARAIGTVFGKHRTSERPLAIGSVKSNIGHLESAAGVAGLLKACLVLRHGMLVPNVHFQSPNPEIPFDDLHLRVVTEVEPWPAAAGDCVGVNSFGFGGASAHVLLQRYVDPAEAGARQSTTRSLAPERKGCLLPLSAKSPQALGDYIQRYRDFVLGNGATAGLPELCAAVGSKREHHAYRVAVWADGQEALAEHLSRAHEGSEDENVKRGQVQRQIAESPVVFVLSGQGPQWWAMGRELLDSDPTFRGVIERCEVELSRHADWSLIEELRRDEHDSRIGETNIAQPAIFALQLALAEMWMQAGVRPAAVIGHSIGEVAAAHLAGVLSFEDAVKLIYHRSRVQQQASGQGKMLAVGLTRADAEAIVADYSGQVYIGAANGAQSMVLSGDPEPLEAIRGRLEAERRFARFLQVDVAFHSHQMDPLEGELKRSLADLKPRAPSFPMYSTVTGQRVTDELLDADYWWANIREPVEFSPTIDRLVRDGFGVFIEIGPHPIHKVSIEEALAAAKTEGLALGSLVRKAPERRALLTSMAELYVRGVELDWRGVNAAEPAKLALPHYPWQRTRHWNETEASIRMRSVPAGHPLVGLHETSPDDPERHVWRIDLDPRRIAWLEDHRVQGPMVFPGAGHMDLALGCFEQLYGRGRFDILEVRFEKPLFIFDDRPPPDVQVVLQGDRRFAICSRQVDASDWVTNSTGRVRERELEPPPRLDLESLRRQAPDVVDPAELYATHDRNGLMLGPTFKALTQLGGGPQRSIGRIEAPPAIARDVLRHCSHPGLLDSSFQSMTLAVGFDPESTEKKLYIPTAIGKLTMYGPPSSTLWAYSEGHRETSEGQGESELWILNDEGEVHIHIQGFQVKSITRQVDAEQDLTDWLYTLDWVPRVHQRTGRLAPFVPEVTALAAAVEPVVRAARESDLHAEYHMVEREIDRLCIGYTTAALRDLGLNFTPGWIFDTDEQGVALGIAPQQKRLFRRLLQLLELAGLLESDGEEWKVVATPEAIDTDELLAQIRAVYPGYEPELRILEPCGRHQAAVLRGELNPTELLFPNGDLIPMAELYRSSHTFDFANLIPAKIVEELVAALPDDRPLRVLEIGAGTGGTTQRLLEVLPANRTQYVFTDVGALFLGAAQNEWREWDFLEFRELDIERAPEEQGFGSGYYDLVVASNVLHATRDLTETLRHCRRLLAPGGCLIIVEVTKPALFAELTVGLTEGWWRFEDRELRRDLPLLSEAAWPVFLRDVGFEDAVVLSDKRVATESSNAVILARTSPHEVPWTAALPEPGPWLVLADRSGLGQALVEACGEGAEGSLLVYAGREARELGGGRHEVDPASAEQLRQLLEKAAQGPRPCRGIWHLWALDHLESEPTAATLAAGEIAGGYSIVSLAQAYQSVPWAKPPPISIVTRGAQPVLPAERGVPLGACAWGVFRALRSERSEVPASIVDLPAAPSVERDVRTLLDESSYGTADDEEAAFRDGRRYVRRVTRLPKARFERLGVAEERVGRSTFVAEPPADGHLSSLAYRRLEPTPRLAPGEVEVRVLATSLNFRDVMLATGLLSEGATHSGYFGASLGLECAGVVTRVGPGVTRFTQGDRVAGFARAAFASQVLTTEENLFSVPDDWSDTEAATTPIAYATAFQALVGVGRLARGERVLIHSGAGGVGWAAIQIALDQGAEVYATAGNDVKRRHLLDLGVRGAFDSRTLAFVDAVREATQGRGVDLVLNSLQGPYIQAGIDVLATGGRFVEIGKKDIYENYRLGLGPFANNLTYSAVDIDQMIATRPDWCQKTLHEIRSKIIEGAYAKIPVREFGPNELESAFRHMMAARHIGKIAVRYSPDEIVEVTPGRDLARLRSDGTYLVVGGTRGFGLRTAEGFVEQGAGTVVLASRSGSIAPGDQAAVDAMRQAGAEVVVERVDVTDEAEVAKLFERLRSLPPLRGVLQSAMVIDDGAITSLTPEQYENAVRPKVDGAWNLHRHTASLELDHFITYSSMSYVTGTPGQANYAAANAYLEALVRRRRAEGLPGLNLNWGVIGEVGYVARNSLDTLSRLGWTQAVSPAAAVDFVFEALARGVDSLCVAGMDWRRMAESIAMYGQSKRYRHLVRDSGNDGADDGELKAQLCEQPLEAAMKTMKEALVAQVERIFGASSTELDPDVPLTDLGMDSLMAGQIRNWTAGALGIDYPTMGLMRGPTITELANDLLAITRGETVVGAEQVAGTSRVLGNPWIHCLQPRSDSASTRLFAFPFAGGGASVFNPWNETLPRDIEINGIQYPGRENRIHEPPLREVGALVQQICDAIVPLLDRSFVLYGHSLGCLVAYEVARRLEQDYSEVPLRLIASGWLAPTQLHHYLSKLRGIDETFDIARATDEEVQAALAQNGLIFDEPMSDDMKRAVMPSVRGDFALLSQYRHEERLRLRCPITVLAGDRDPLFTEDELLAWEDLTTGEFRFRRVEGEHLFVLDKEGSHTNVIAEELRATEFPVFDNLDMSAE